MTGSEDFTNMRSLMTALAKAMNLMSPDVEKHHERTAYLTYFIAHELGLPAEDRNLAMYAALLHDIGSIADENPQTIGEIEHNAREISLLGADMLGDLPGFNDIAHVIGYCQCSWEETLRCVEVEGAVCERLGQLASIVHLADVVSIAINPNGRVLNQVGDICDAVRTHSGSEFCPQAAEAFLNLASTEYIWMDVAHNPEFLLYFTGDIKHISLEETRVLTGFMSRIIDFRSPFTAMHSAGVAASARELALLAGMSETDAIQVEIAGNLHDVGKLAVPKSILEKPGKLTDEEFNIVKEHPYYTSLVLLGVEGFGQISNWASRHHEKLNGRGYPFHRSGDELDTGSRILAVADIFSAITEERPYRAGMTREKAASILEEDARSGAICKDLVALLIDNYDSVDAARDAASHAAGQRYFDSLAE